MYFIVYFIFRLFVVFILKQNDGKKAACSVCAILKTKPAAVWNYPWLSMQPPGQYEYKNVNLIVLVKNRESKGRKILQHLSNRS